MVKKKSTSSSPKKQSGLNKFLSNYWAVATVVLAILLIIALATQGMNNSVGAKITSEDAGNAVLEFAEAQGASASLVEVTDAGSLYEVTVEIQGQQVPVYVTKDGENLVPSVIALNEEVATSTPAADSQPTPNNIPKSDKPIVELFIMSHCPYGTQMEKGILPVAELLGDKIDMEFKFVYYAMHGEVEVVEQLNQYCIQEEQNDLFLPYLTCFLEDGDGDRCLDAVGIDTGALETCKTAADAEFDIMANLEDTSSYLSGRFPLFATHADDNAKYSVGGSPTLIINGVEAQIARDSQTILNTICASFEDAPEECATEFDAGSPSPGFGYGTAQASNNAAAGCGY